MVEIRICILYATYLVAFLYDMYRAYERRGVDSSNELSLSITVV